MIYASMRDAFQQLISKACWLLASVLQPLASKHSWGWLCCGLRQRSGKGSRGRRCEIALPTRSRAIRLCEAFGRLCHPVQCWTNRSMPKRAGSFSALEWMEIDHSHR